VLNLNQTHITVKQEPVHTHTHTHTPPAGYLCGLVLQHSPSFVTEFNLIDLQIGNFN